MASRIPIIGAFTAVIVAAINAAKAQFGTFSDPGHTHAGGTGVSRAHERLVPPAPGTQIHASIAAGGALNVSSAFTRIMPASNIRISRGGAGNATVYTVTGTRFGSAQTETINSNGASDVEGVKIFDTVTNLASDVDPGVTTTVKSGVIVGLDRVAVSVEFLAVGTTDANGVVETATLNTAKDGFTPTTAPDGSKIFHIRYTNTPGTTASAVTGITTAFNGTSKFHLDASEITITLADATDLSSLIALANQCKYVLARGDGQVGGHPGHLLDAVAHPTADTTNAVTAADASDLATSETLVAQMRTKLNAHFSQSGVHLNNDGTTTIDATACDSLNHTITVVNSVKAAINTHMANAMPGASLRAVPQ